MDKNLVLLIGNTATKLDAQNTEWTLYVKTKEPEFQKLLRRVDVKLHETFVPPTVTLTSPFTITRQGWGTFTVKLQVEVVSHQGKVVRGAFNYKLQFDRSDVALEYIMALPDPLPARAQSAPVQKVIPNVNRFGKFYDLTNVVISIGDYTTIRNKDYITYLHHNARYISTFAQSFIVSTGELVWGLGRNEYAQIGCIADNNTTNYQTVEKFAPVKTFGPQHKIAEIVSERNFTLFRTVDSQVYFAGRYMNDATTHHSGPKRMAHFDMLRFKNNNHSASVRVIKMASSPTHSMFIVSDGSVYALGSNHVFQCGVDNVAYLHNIEYIKYFKEKSIAVKDVACGSLHTMFLALDGSCYSCGNNESAQLGLGSISKKRLITSIRGLPEPVKHLQSINNLSLFLTENNKVFACGQHSQVVPGLPEYIEKPTEILLPRDFLLSSTFLGPLGIAFVSKDSRVILTGKDVSGYNNQQPMRELKLAALDVLKVDKRLEPKVSVGERHMLIYFTKKQYSATDFWNLNLNLAKDVPNRETRFSDVSIRASTMSLFSSNTMDLSYH